MLEMPQQALAALDRIHDERMLRFMTHQLRGMAYRDLRQHEEALRHFERALHEEPDNVDVLMAMAWCYKRIDRLDRAIAVNEEAYHIDENNSLVVYNMACYLSLAGEKQQALSWLGRALRMDRSLRELIDEESDFDNLRHDPDFELLVNAAA